MAQFQFRLATLLKLRERLRDERRGQLAEALRIDDDLRSRVQALGDELQGALRLQAPEPGAINVDRLLDATRYELVLRAEQGQLRAQQAALGAELEKRREALAAADREVRTLERLRETRREQFRAEQEAKAAKEMDEVAMQRYAAEVVG
jgi:flagellar protein FliJ